jgi:hypothetical protein
LHCKGLNQMEAVRGTAEGIELVEPLIFLIEGGDGDVEDAHLSDGAMATAWLDENGGRGLYRHYLAVKLHRAGPFKDEINLCELFVIVGLRIFFDVHYVHRGGGVVVAEKGPAREAARALDRIDIIEPCNHVIGHVLPPNPDEPEQKSVG